MTRFASPRASLSVTFLAAALAFGAETSAFAQAEPDRQPEPGLTDPATPPSDPPSSEPPPGQPQPEPPATSSPPSSSPGLLGTLGGWLKGSATGVSDTLKGTQERIDALNKGALETLTRLPSAGVVNGRALCQVAANGAPDCYAASEKLCKDKGYATGQSLLTESSENCKPRVFLPGYKRKEGDCRIDTVVTRASCQ